MIKKESGFTLMEIMVVIIVIAVLASVAGPMIGSITDQGRASATKSKISALKSAMLAYQSDTGRLPFVGKPDNAGCVVAYCDASVLGDSLLNNVLVNEVLGNITGGGLNFGISNYTKKWKGPYMDADPIDFMYDSWGNRMKYIAFGTNIFLWSSGPDSAFEACITSAMCGDAISNGDVDDIAMSIARSRKAFN